MGSCLTLLASLAYSQLSDPTEPVWYTSADDSHIQNLRSQYRLTSLLFGDSRRLVTLNGQQAKEGQMVDGAKVIAIGQSSVRLIKEGVQFSIAMSDTNFKRKQNDK